MRWGVRRYQNTDGSLTPAGKKRQAKADIKAEKRAVRLQKKHPGKDMESIEKFYAKRKNARKMLRVASGISLTSRAMNKVGQTLYDAYKDGASTTTVNAVRGLGYASKALSVVGDITTIAAYGDYYTAMKEFKRS